jgi:small-conductance mechanosensitive channel
MKIPLNNDRLSHWLVGAVFSWGLTFLLLFFPIFHWWLNVPTTKVATLTGLFCAAQLAITPWLFSARATRQNPNGRPAQRAVAVAVLASLIALLFFGYISGLWPKDAATREFASVGLALTVLLAILLVAMRRKWFVKNSGTKNSENSGPDGTDGILS